MHKPLDTVVRRVALLIDLGPRCCSWGSWSSGPTGDASDDVLCPPFGFVVVSVVRESATSAASIGKVRRVRLQFELIFFITVYKGLNYCQINSTFSISHPNISQKSKGSEVDDSIFLLNVFDIILAALFSVHIFIKMVQ